MNWFTASSVDKVGNGQNLKQLARWLLQCLCTDIRNSIHHSKLLSMRAFQFHEQFKSQKYHITDSSGQNDFTRFFMKVTRQVKTQNGRKTWCDEAFGHACIDESCLMSSNHGWNTITELMRAWNEVNVWAGDIIIDSPWHSLSFQRSLAFSRWLICSLARGHGYCFFCSGHFWSKWIITLCKKMIFSCCKSLIKLPLILCTYVFLLYLHKELP